MTEQMQNKKKTGDKSLLHHDSLAHGRFHFSHSLFLLLVEKAKTMIFFLSFHLTFFPTQHFRIHIKILDGISEAFSLK